MARAALLLLPCLGAALLAPSRRHRSTRLGVALSPEAMIALQKFTNKADFEKTVAAYAAQKRLSLPDAELEYARYLMDPDKFVLDAAAASKGVAEARPKKPADIMKAGFGQRRSPLLQAYIDEGGPEVEARISTFERSNTIKACAIIACVFAFVITWDPVVPVQPHDL
jgi:hypothetical protein